VQGVKTPCAFNKTDFSNFLSLKNLGSAGQKDFFDTLNMEHCKAVLHVENYLLLFSENPI